MSCILKAHEPIPTVHKKRLILGSSIIWRQFFEKPSGSRSPLFVCRASCFQRDAKLRAATKTALPWTTCTNLVGEKSFKSQPSKPLPIINPTNIALCSKATTLGLFSAGAMSVAKASPAVCVVCIPAPTNKNAKQAPTLPIQTVCIVSSFSSNNANGMIANPPNIKIFPIQR